jgi:hypothetical protein
MFLLNGFGQKIKQLFDGLVKLKERGLPVHRLINSVFDFGNLQWCENCKSECQNPKSETLSKS